MVEIFTINRTGGPYTDSVYGSQTNPSVTIKVLRRVLAGKDIELAIDIPETTAGNQPVTLGGGFKRMTIGFTIEGYLDDDPSSEEDTQTKVEKLWNIFEYANPTSTYATYRGNPVFGISSPTNGQVKIVSLKIEENASISEPAKSISGSNSEPYRAKVTMEIRKVSRTS